MAHHHSDSCVERGFRPGETRLAVDERRCREAAHPSPEDGSQALSAPSGVDENCGRMPKTPRDGASRPSPCRAAIRRRRAGRLNSIVTDVSLDAPVRAEAPEPRRLRFGSQGWSRRLREALLIEPELVSRSRRLIRPSDCPNDTMSLSRDALTQVAASIRNSRWPIVRQAGSHALCKSVRPGVHRMLARWMWR